ncbi:MAG TPA: hypothetical protein VHL80_11640, partial [Polyangia bacterium]|nr:hypothetical protein [Polyangia bacterium]
MSSNSALARRVARALSPLALVVTLACTFAACGGSSKKAGAGGAGGHGGVGGQSGGGGPAGADGGAGM